MRSNSKKVAFIAAIVLVVSPCLAQNSNFKEIKNNLNLEMIFVQGGTFTMGCNSGHCEPNELPTHQVTLSDFYMGKYEVTQAQWVAVMGSNPSIFKGDNLPVENVSYGDVQEFILKLNSLTGKQYRLPTEAECEFAGRGGTHFSGYEYSGSDANESVAWYHPNSDNTTHPVGSKFPNKLDIYDMSGNVFEWCNDWYGEYSSSLQINPQGPSTGTDRVLRGGSWRGKAFYLRMFTRLHVPPERHDSHYGFRLACSSK